MKYTTPSWPLIPSSNETTGHGGDQTCPIAGGAKNLWVRTGCRWKLDLGTYNVRTLSREGDLAAKLEELKEINWDIIGLSEVRRVGESYLELNEGHIFCFRGHESNKENGVGFLINKNLAGNIEEFFSISDRIAGLIIKLNKKYKMKIIQIYAPTSTHTDEEMEIFYEDLDRALKKQKTQFTFVIGDFNAKVGQKRRGELAMGNFGIGSRNNRGDMLVEFAERNNLKIMNTFFNKKENRKWTWRSPNGETKNEIDFILSEKASIIKDVTVLNKLKSSDHRMVRCRIDLDLKKERENLILRKKINTPAVREKSEEFSLMIQNRFSQLSDEVGEDKEIMNENITTIIHESALEVGGRVPKRNQGKLSQNTKNLIKKRMELKMKSRRDEIELAELSKTINKEITQDIRKYNQSKIEDALKNGGSTKLIRRKLGTGRQQVFALKDSNGNIVSNRDGIIKVAEEFYTMLFQSNMRDAYNIANRNNETPGEVPNVTLGEVRKGLKGMKRGKAAGEDGLTIDLIIDGGDFLIIKLADLYTKCLQECSIPTAWKNFIIILIHKKGDIKDLKNYRPISLLSVIYKLFTKIISNRVERQLEFNQPREQAGFRSGYSTTDHIHVLNQLMEKSTEYDKPLCLAFIDYEKAFDSVEISAVMQALRKQGIQETYVRTLEDVYTNSTATIKLHKDSERIPIGKGVRQGDTISPKLFTACLEEVFKNLEWENVGIKIDGEYLNNLRFADDIVLMSESGEELQMMLGDLNRESRKIGLKMNMGKTKVMFNENAVREEIRIMNEPLEIVNEYTYLGQTVSSTPGHETEIKRRISMGWRAFGKQCDILKSKMPLSLKRKIFNQVILPVLTYGSETWSLTKAMERKLVSTQRAMERIMMGITLKDRKRATWIRMQTKVEDILATIKKKKWTWAGHVMRRSDNRWTLRITEWIPRESRRSRGRKRRRWSDEIRKFVGVDWHRRARDRCGWKEMSEAFVLQWTDNG